MQIFINFNNHTYVIDVNNNTTFNYIVNYIFDRVSYNKNLLNKFSNSVYFIHNSKYINNFNKLLVDYNINNNDTINCHIKNKHFNDNI